jgi:ribosomal-protein-alanine N-acetyltransferase
MRQFPLETERLLLRPVTESDLPRLLDILADSEVMKLALYERPLSAAEAQQFIDDEFARHADDLAKLAVLCLRSEETVIGFAGLLPCKYLPGELEFGFVLAHDAQGKGYATEIGSHLIEVGFQSLNRERLYALCDPRNAASRDVLGRKLRMRFVNEILTPDRGPRMIFEISNPSALR